MWTGVPLLSVIPQLQQYSRIRRGDAASYDEGKFRVLQDRTGTGAYLLAGVIFFIVIVAISEMNK